MAVQKDISVAQGHTYAAVLRWETTPIVRKPISAISDPNGAARIACSVPHGIVDGWRVAVAGVTGMKKINAGDPNKIAASEYYQATLIDANTVELNDLDISSFGTYGSGGFLVYNTPADMTGFTFNFRMKTKEGGTVLASNLVADGALNILTLTPNVALHTILYSFPSTATVVLAGKSGWYDIEAVSPDVPPVVTQLACGTVKVSKE